MKTKLANMIAVITAMAALMSGIVVVTLNNNQAFAQQTGNTTAKNTTSSSSSSASSSTPNLLNFSRALGTISSIQNNASGKPTWILTGPWQLIVPKPLKVSPTSPPTSAIFNATFKMIKIDGTEPHTHTISDFKLTHSSVNNMQSVFNGTATVTLKDGPHKDVPVSIKIMNQGAMSLWIDPTKTNNHFGNTPIYGTVSVIGVFLTAT
jgi:hypothetical protein